jgi:hypothetical protein
MGICALAATAAIRSSDSRVTARKLCAPMPMLIVLPENVADCLWCARNSSMVLAKRRCSSAGSASVNPARSYSTGT